jgi:hypothetical protein
VLLRREARMPRVHGCARLHGKGKGVGVILRYSSLAKIDTDPFSVVIRLWRKSTPTPFLFEPEFKTKDQGGVWCESEIKSRHYYLSPEGLYQLRSAIRQEQRERRDSASAWIGWSIGLIGALTGLVSMIKK